MFNFKWREYYVSNVEWIDNGHKKIASMINKFGKSIYTKRTKEELDNQFRAIVYEIKNHLTKEKETIKKLLIDSRYAREHNREYKLFEKEANILIARMGQGIVSYQGIFYFLSGWLSIHIIGTSKILSNQIKEIQNGKSPNNAYDIAYASIDNTKIYILTTANNLFSMIIGMNNEISQINQSLEEKIKKRTKELERANSVLKTMALTDPLTKLGNRRATVAYLKSEWDKPFTNRATITCIIIDIDKFKYINDREGHGAGDRVLQIVSHTIKNSIRNDDFVCRLGGDEFVILSNNTNFKEILKLAEHVRKQVNRTKIMFDNHHWRGSISIGVAARDKHMLNYIDLLKKADDGLYIAKRKGGNRVGYI